MPDKKNVTTEYELYKLDSQYKSRTNFINYINEQQNFYNGQQYPKDGNPLNAIRVTMNICSMCVQIKASKICGTPIYLTFTADDPDTDCTSLRQFDEYNYNKMKMDAHNYQSAINGYVNGTEIVYMPWDDDDTTYKGIYKGGINLEHIDPRNFAVANPYLSDIQKQKWVMFWEDYDINAILDMVEGESKEEIKEKKEIIRKGEKVEGEESYKDKELINHELVTMFTRFFRVNGEVYFMCSTEKVNLFKYPHPLSRKVAKKAIKDVVDKYVKQLKEDKEKEGEQTEKIFDYQIDYEDLLTNATGGEIFTDKDYEKSKEKFNLYPFAIWEPSSQNRSFYGRSDIKNLIPTQRAINFVLSMIAKCAENNAYNKIFAKEGALGDQVITNEPSQILVDYSSFTNGWGIKMAESQPLPNGLLDFAQNLLSMTRIVYGFNEVMDGSVTNQDMSGYMLQQMIKQSNTAIEQQQLLFWRFQEDMAAIRLLYYKHYVESARYTVELTDSEMEGQEQARNILNTGINNGVEMETMKQAGVPEDVVRKQLGKEIRKVKVETIKNEDIWGKNFDIAIDAEQGLADSKLVEQQTWDNLILNNGIQNISPTLLSLYLQAAPNISPRTKAALKNVVKNLEMSENQQLKNQLQELAQQTAQIMSYAKQLEAANGYQSEYLKNLQAEFTNKINVSNKIIDGMQKQMENIQSASEGASEGEVKSNNAKGISGTHTSVQ